jgi:hypothetical protein
MQLLHPPDITLQVARLRLHKPEPMLEVAPQAKLQNPPLILEQAAVTILQKPPPINE